MSDQPRSVSSSPEFSPPLRKAVMAKMVELLTAALSLVAALAWNDAIQSLFLQLFGPMNSMIAKFIYALFITAIVVWIGFRLARLMKNVE